MVNRALDLELAIFKHLGALEVTPSMPVLNSGMVSVKPARYFEVAHLPNPNERWLIGSDEPQRRSGILQVTLCTEPDLDAETLKNLANEIVQWFPTDERLVENNLEVRITKEPDIASGYFDESHWRIPVSVYYEAYA